MFILPYEEKLLQTVQTFITPYEYTCAGLAAVIRRNSEPVYIISSASEINATTDIVGLFSYQHSIFHCLPNIYALDSSFQTQFINFFADKKVNSIIGERQGTEFIYSLLEQAGKTLEKKVDYKMMTLNLPPVPPPDHLYNDDEIRRCYYGNLEELLNLQKEYMEEEIAPVGRHITDLEAKASLKLILKSQLCLAMYSNEEAVAKVNSNAIAFNWVQIGGVYTNPLYRRNYYAWHLMYVLCSKIIKTNRCPCLFVKEKNLNAFSLYSKIGFQQRGLFSIIYLKK